MILVPIVERELRSAARQEFTYYLRVIGVGGVLLASSVFLFHHGDDPNFGGRLFADLHLTLFCAIWIVVPFLTADCISQERREGTLGLLFLTRLNSRDVVIAKSLAHGLRALTLWVAVLPMMAVPFLLGGVTWTEALTSVMVNSSAICLALAAGLCASSFSRLWSRVALWAGILSAVFCFVFVSMFPLILSASIFSLPRLLGQLGSGRFFTVFLEGGRVATDWEACWPDIFSRWSTHLRNVWLAGSGLSTLLSMLGLLVAIRLVAGRVRRMWQEEPPSARVIWLQEKLCQPRFFQRFFQWWMKQKLENNPVGWLELRSWSGRLVAWGWLGLVAFIYSGLLTESGLFRTFTSGSQATLHQLMAWLLGASMALSSAGSFRRERESGVLELLLVSPLGEDEIIIGRLRGLWSQFLPAGCLLLAVWFFITSLFGFSSSYGGGPDLKIFVYYATGFLGLPVIGLYFSLACRGFLMALLATLAVGLLAAPALASWICWAWGLSPDGGLSADEALLRGPVLPFQLLLTVLCWFGLSVRLKKRSFPLQRS
jgi:ABC-type transport system involved in multi-copper enzyme maturation permease subunit